MRMRVIKPDFWESEHVADLSLFARLLLAALWSYVDDNGVQKDNPVSLAGECFRFDLARDVHQTLAAIEAGLTELWLAGWLIRYTVGVEKYLEMADWSLWQKPDHPSKPRFPDSRSSDAVIVLPSRGPRETLPRLSRPDTETESESESESEGDYSPPLQSLRKQRAREADRANSEQQNDAPPRDYLGPEERARLDGRADRLTRELYDR
jgi:hypothetical protein